MQRKYLGIDPDTLRVRYEDGPGEEIPLRPIPLFKTKPVEIKTLPEWVKTDEPVKINISIFDRAYLLYHQSAEATRVTLTIIRIIIGLISLMNAINKFMEKK